MTAQPSTTVSEQSTESTSATVINGVTTPAKPKRASRATRSAAKTAAPKQTAKPKTPAKPAPAKTELTDAAKRVIVLNEWIAAALPVIASYPKNGITRDEAARIISERAKYAGAKCTYPKPLTV